MATLPPVPHRTTLQEEDKRLTQPWVQWLEELRRLVNDASAITGTLQHSALLGVTPNQHHAQSHTHSDGSTGLVSYEDLTDTPEETGAQHDNTLHVTDGFPSSSAVGDGVGQGSSLSVSRLDHVHGREAFAPPGQSTPGNSVSEGLAASVARSDHQHGREVAWPCMPFFPEAEDDDDMVWIIIGA